MWETDVHIFIAIILVVSSGHVGSASQSIAVPPTWECSLSFGTEGRWLWANWLSHELWYRFLCTPSSEIYFCPSLPCRYNPPTDVAMPRLDANWSKARPIVWSIIPIPAHLHTTLSSGVCEASRVRHSPISISCSFATLESPSSPDFSSHASRESTKIWSPL